MKNSPKKKQKKSDKSDTVRERIKRDKEKFLKKFQECISIVSISCSRAGISRETYYDWLKKDKKFAAKVEEIKERQNDAVEDRLLKQILKDNSTCIMFFLKARHPKYKPKMDITTDGESLNIPRAKQKKADDAIKDYLKH